jgi:DNA invertase Pin-like site-specific DNA recombinase
VDRLGRSLQDLIGFLQELHGSGVELYLHQQALDTTTPGGRAMFQMMGVFAEFERSMISERVKSGLARAKSNGKTLGRPKVSDECEQQILKLRSQGMGILKIGKELGVGTSTVQRVISQ